MGVLYCTISEYGLNTHRSVLLKQLKILGRIRIICLTLLLYIVFPFKGNDASLDLRQHASYLKIVERRLEKLRESPNDFSAHFRT